MVFSTDVAADLPKMDRLDYIHLGDYLARADGRAPMGLEQAQHYLAGRVRVRTPLGAVEYLDHALTDADAYNKRLAVALNCMEIYKVIFPEEYANSTSPYLSTQREHELYRLVNDRVFPLLMSEDADIETHMRREPLFFLPYIPMRGVQRHVWAGGQFHFWEIEMAYRLVQVLSGMTGRGGKGWQALSLYCGLENVPPPAPPIAAVGWTLFNYSCAVEQNPLKALPKAFEMITYRTGNPWLDLPQVGFVGFGWSIERITGLLGARLEAEQITEAIDELSVWLEEDPAARIARVVELWNDAAAKEVAAGGEGLYIDDDTQEWRHHDWYDDPNIEMRRDN